jgi:hypothetical protein
MTRIDRAVPDDLLSPAATAEKLEISERTLREHVRDGSIVYVVKGRGTKRPRKGFLLSDIEDFKRERRRRSEPEPCPSTDHEDRGSTSTTSGAEIVGFSALQAKRARAKHTR